MNHSFLGPELPRLCPPVPGRYLRMREHLWVYVWVGGVCGEGEGMGSTPVGGNFGWRRQRCLPGRP